jgi:hypothetical protein
MRPGFAAAAVVLAVACAAAPAFAQPVVSVWYRGTPAGTPRLDDLGAISAAGFSTVTWPASATDQVGELSRLAEQAGIAVVLQPDVPSLELAARTTVNVSAPAVEDRLPAIVWHAVALGRRIISLDPRQTSGTGLRTDRGEVPAWVAVAARINRQLSANATLFEVMKPAARPRVLSGRWPGFDAALFQTERAWVLIATNTGRTTARATVQMPAAVPYAIWVSLIDGSTVGMVDRPDGARWTSRLEPGEAAVYVIDKTPK